jgi:hypothetical protein
MNPSPSTNDAILSGPDEDQTTTPPMAPTIEIPKEHLVGLNKEIEYLKAVVARLENTGQHPKLNVDIDATGGGGPASPSGNPQDHRLPGAPTKPTLQVPLHESVRATPTLNFLTLHEYESREFSFRTSHAAIDVIVMGEVIAKTGPSDHPDKGTPTTVAEEKIRFIQINSPALDKILNEEPDDFTAPSIILSPFHAVTHQMDALAARLDKLEEQFGSLLEDSSSGHSVAGATENNDDDPQGIGEDKNQIVPSATATDNADAKGLEMMTDEDAKADSLQGLLALRCLMQFYQDWIKPRWDILRGGSLAKAFYGDLCTVFQPGDDIFVPESSQKFFRVIKVTDGRPMPWMVYSGNMYDEKANTALPASSTGAYPGADPMFGDTRLDPYTGRSRFAATGPVNWATLYINCYSLAFDGKHVVTVRHRFEIRPFDGMRDLTSLSAYPLRLSKIPQEIKDQYEGRKVMGNRFLEICQGRLFYFDGRTFSYRSMGPYGEQVPLRAKAEDIASHVVIDFEKAYQVSDPPFAHE